MSNNPMNDGYGGGYYGGYYYGEGYGGYSEGGNSPSRTLADYLLILPAPSPITSLSCGNGSGGS
jgi:hypothetical protein